jgi:hypothetical protein
MRFFLFAITALVLCNDAAVAQHAVAKKFKAPLAGTVILRDVEDKYSAQVYSMQMPDPDASEEQERLREIKKQVNLKFPYRSDPGRKSTAAVPMPNVAIGFVSDSFSGIPPDNYSAVSKGNKAVAVMNSSIAVHDAVSGSYLMRKDLMAFCASTGLNNSITVDYNYKYDPKIVYDPEADRFISVILNGTLQHNYIIVGFTKTNDPGGEWNFYKFYGDYAADTTWFDYPQISITKNEFFLTGNKIIYDSSWQAGFTRTLIYQMNKKDGYNGDTALSYQIWDDIGYNNKRLRCLYPLNPGNTLLGPAQYFLSNRNFDIANDTVFLVKVPDTIGSNDTNLVVTPIVSSTAYGVPPDGRQPNASLRLATNDGRVLGGFIKDDEIQFVSTSVNPINGAAGIYHGIISNFTSAPVLTAQIYGYDTLDFGYPNISYTGRSGGHNQSIISFDYAGPHTFAGFGAVFYDGNGYSPLLKIKTGIGNISYPIGTPQRWGDYSGSQPDWNDIGSVWVEGIFGRKDLTYGNYMAKLVSPAHVSVPTASLPVSPAVVYPNPAWEFVSFDFNVTADQSFTFIICDVQGKIVDKVLDRYCHDGKNVIRFNIAPLAPGTYFLRAAGARGENIPVHMFVKK